MYRVRQFLVGEEVMVVDIYEIGWIYAVYEERNCDNVVVDYVYTVRLLRGRYANAKSDDVNSVQVKH